MLTAVEFTAENAERELKTAFPQIVRVSDDLPAGVIPEENLTYAQSDGRSLQLDLYRPGKGGLHLAILIVHGGGWETGRREMERPFAKRLAERGYATVPVSYRLGERGRFPAALHDLKAAVRWLRLHAAEQGTDARQIGVVGTSAGGQLAALLGAGNGVDALEGEEESQGSTSAVQAVVDIDGLADFTEPHFVAQQAERPSAPTLFINSTAPTPVLPGREVMRDRLRAFGVAAEIVVIPNTRIRSGFSIRGSSRCSTRRTPSCAKTFRVPAIPLTKALADRPGTNQVGQVVPVR